MLQLILQLLQLFSTADKTDVLAAETTDVLSEPRLPATVLGQLDIDIDIGL